MIEERIDRPAIAVHDVQEPLRHAGLGAELVDEIGARGITLGGLEDEPVAAGERHRDHPQGNHEGKVEGRDAGDDAERLPLRAGVESARHIAAEIALEELGNAAGVLDHLERARHLAQRVLVGLAVLGRDRARDMVTAIVDQRPERKHHPRPPRRRPFRPLFRRPGGRCHRRIDIGRRAEYDLGGLLAGGGVEDRSGPGGAAGGGFAVNDMFDPSHEHPYSSSFRTSRRVSAMVAICSSLMMSGGESAMMSPVVRMSRPFS